jgi:hypothetical protein
MAILVIGLVGTVVELLLLKHTDGFWQWVPLALLACELLVLAWYAATKAPHALRVHRAMMVAFVLSGGVGAIQHFRGNVAYEKDSDPSLSGMALYRRALSGSTPSLAPGTMVQLGLLGLLFAFRHPRLVRGEDQPQDGIRS